MPGRIDEVEATVHAVVNNVAAIQTTFILQVLLKLAVNVLDYLFVATVTNTY